MHLLYELDDIFVAHVMLPVARLKCEQIVGDAPTVELNLRSHHVLVGAERVALEKKKI